MSWHLSSKTEILETPRFLKQIYGFLKNSDFRLPYTHIDAEFHGEFIFGRFKTIRKCLDDLNRKKTEIKFDSSYRFLNPPRVTSA